MNVIYPSFAEHLKNRLTRAHELHSQGKHDEALDQVTRCLNEVASLVNPDVSLLPSNADYAAWLAKAWAVNVLNDEGYEKDPPLALPNGLATFNPGSDPFEHGWWVTPQGYDFAQKHGPQPVAVPQREEARELVETDRVKVLEVDNPHNEDMIGRVGTVVFVGDCTIGVQMDTGEVLVTHPDDVSLIEEE